MFVAHLVPLTLLSLRLHCVVASRVGVVRRAFASAFLLVGQEFRLTVQWMENWIARSAGARLAAHSPTQPLLLAEPTNSTISKNSTNLPSFACPRTSSCGFSVPTSTA